MCMSFQIRIKTSLSQFIFLEKMKTGGTLVKEEELTLV